MKEKDVYENAIVVEGLRKTESGRYAKIAKRAFDMYEKLHGRQPNPMFRSAIGHVLENFEQWKLTEAVSQASMPYLRDYGFELIVALLPGLIANELFTVQPAKFKNYSVFYQDFQYGELKNGTAANTAAIQSLSADTVDPNYTLDSETNRQFATGTGALATFTVGVVNTFRKPMVASSITITAPRVGGTMTLVDNGAGALTGDTGVGANIVDYTTGALTCTFVANVTNGGAVLITYTFLGEGSQTNAAEYNMVISEKQGQARERRLRYNFSIESQFSYRQQFGRALDPDMLAAAMAEIRREVDEELTMYQNTVAKNHVGINASAGAVTWTRAPDAGVQYYYWREQFIDTLNSAGNLIKKAVGFGGGNIVTGGINFKQVCETIGPRFKGADSSDVKGACFIGTLDGTRKCFYEPAYGDNEFVVGYKAQNPLLVGISFNPWMPLYASDPHMLADGKLHRYLITSNGKLLVNARLYAQGTLI